MTKFVITVEAVKTSGPRVDPSTLATAIEVELDAFEFEAERDGGADDVSTFELSVIKCEPS